MTAQLPWWRTTTIYQIYPRSFYDANKDGIGDLRGIINRLDYIQELGFETIWFSPFTCSPQEDFGYDVSDYTNIAPEYGTMTEVEDLIQAIHDRGMRILLDLALNHTSIQHPWFQQSRSSRDNPKRDWYIWRDGKGKHPPNNWYAIPLGSAWHYDATTDQYYYASFLPFQPDLNWRNPAVKDAMFNVIRFWLDKGVDGFRLDIFHAIYKDQFFRDNPFSWYFIPKDMQAGFFQQWKYSLNQPETFELAAELRSLLDEYSPDRILIGEVFGTDETLRKYLGNDQDGLHLVFLWRLLNLKPRASYLRKVIHHYEVQYPAPYEPVYVFGNHDVKRVISHTGDNLQIAKLLAVFQFTVRGVPVTYFGEEIGMADGDFPKKTALDPVGWKFRYIPKFIFDWFGLYVNRDGCRTPMQWDESSNSGFCEDGITPWLPVHPNYPFRNVQAQEMDDESVLNTYKAVLRLRQGVSALRTGILQILDGTDIDPDLLVYTRTDGDQTVLVVINFANRPLNFINPTPCHRILLTVGVEQPDELSSMKIPPLSAIILGDGEFTASITDPLSPNNA
jgi:oligo-1,6-glucosidase/alpha-glucosidase